ncbi:hypothetical protein ACS0TY_035871 [Phlomoides rotata]
MKNDDYDTEIQAVLDSSMPWVGLYITVASVLCDLAMALDLLNGFAFIKLWFPCNFFTLNAATMTLVAAATKLPLDLNTNMLDSSADTIAQYICLIFLIVVQANLMTSIGSMNNLVILSNVAALNIFVLTFVGNVLLLYRWLRYILGDFIDPVILVPTIFTLVLLMTVVSLSIAIPSIKKSLELKFRHMLFKLSLSEEHVWRRRDAVTFEDLKKYMIKYLVMVETSSPQFVIGRSVVCSFTTFVLFATIIFASIVIGKHPPKGMRGQSPYGNYTAWIFYVQSVGVIIGSIAPTFRLFVAVSLKCSTAFKMDFRIEDHWNEILVEWRDSYSGRLNLCSQCLYDVKWLVLSFFIAIQVFIVLVSRVLFSLFAVLMTPFIWCVKKFLKQESREEQENRDLYRYVLRLEGEAELPRAIIPNVRRVADQLILKGRKMQSKNLLDLLRRSTTFNGVWQFDSIQVPSLNSDHELPKCWTLSIMTLTSVAIAIPNIDRYRAKQLLHSVHEGLSLAKIIEETLIKDDQLASILKVADVCCCKSEKIIEMLQQREWPTLDHDRAAYIDQWRDLPRQNVQWQSVTSNAGENIGRTHLVLLPCMNKLLIMEENEPLQKKLVDAFLSLLAIAEEALAEATGTAVDIFTCVAWFGFYWHRCCFPHGGLVSRGGKSCYRVVYRVDTIR